MIFGRKLTDRDIRDLPVPAKGFTITYDGGPDRLRGFGLCTTAAGAKSFILNYVVAGRERRMVIGSFPARKVSAAREKAKDLRNQIDDGIDPLLEKVALRAAPTVNELGDRYIADHASKKRTGAGDEAMIRRHIRPEFGQRKVASIAYRDIELLHRKVSKTAPYAANRVLALLSKMFALSVKWQMRSDNPCKGVDRNPEEPRYKYLDADELQRLLEALAAHQPQSASNAIRLLMLSGARRGEVLAADWSQFDLQAGIWTKPSSHTKQKREHVVPLSSLTRQLLVGMREEADRTAAEKRRVPSRYLFPARSGGGHVTDLKASWASVCRAANLEGVRLHDLRHSFASALVSAGHSLPTIGALLGHAVPATTARYAHLQTDVLRAATETATAVITGRDKAEVIPLRREQA
jgi:integrase